MNISIKTFTTSSIAMVSILLISSCPVTAQSKLIAFSQMGADGKNNVWSIKEDGTQRRRLTTNGGGDPAWSPDGRQIAFVVTLRDQQGLENSQIWLMNRDGTGKRALTRDTKWNCGSPRFSPDSKQIVFSVSTEEGVDEGFSRVGIRTLNLKSFQTKFLISSEANSEMYGEPTFGPNQRDLYYINKGQEIGNGALMRFDLKTRKARQFYGFGFSKSYHSVNGFSLSPDGKQFAAASDGWVNGSEPESSKAGIILMSRAGTNARVIMKGAYQSPSWSADGRKLICTNDYSLQTFDLKSHKRQVVLRGKNIWNPVFQP